MDPEKLLKLINRYYKTDDWGHYRLGQILMAVYITTESKDEDVLAAIRKAINNLQNALNNFDRDWLNMNI